MPRKSNKQKQKVSTVVAEQPSSGAESDASEHPQDFLADETSDSECKYDATSRKIGRNAARGTLGVRSRRQYTNYQEAMVAWGQQQNADLSAVVSLTS